jgi:hypothetical protein
MMTIDRRSLPLDDASGVAELVAWLRELAERPRVARATAGLRLVVGAAELQILARVADGSGDPSASRDERRVLRVETRGRWFEAPDAARADCTRRPVMRRILVALVEASGASPPRFLSAAEVVRAGWPDERILAAAARNRLHVTMTRLRRHGLSDLLVANDLGYALSPDVAIEIV